MGESAKGPGMVELGRLVCFQTRPRWFWELLVCLSEMCGCSSVGVPGAQREGGVGGSVLLGSVVCSGFIHLACRQVYVC